MTQGISVVDIYRVVEGRYLDSIMLMQISREVERSEGVEMAAVMVATPENISFLKKAGFSPPKTAPSSIIIAVRAESHGEGEAAVNKALQLMSNTSVSRKYRLEDIPNLIQPGDFPVLFISTPGEYVRDIAMKGISMNLHLHIFSSNVPVEQEVEIKRKAREKHLLVMGPDCGTSIIEGKGLGFSNNVLTGGDVLVIGSSGTGIQEVTVQLDRCGVGILNAIGVGSNDMKKEVGGITTSEALSMFADSAKAIIIVAKKPDQNVASSLLPLLEEKTSAFIMLGESQESVKGKLLTTGLIDSGVRHVVTMLGRKYFEQELPEAVTIPADRKLLRGYFAGGSLCYQAQSVLHSHGIDVYSNAPLNDSLFLREMSLRVNTCIDTGAEEFVRGKPHPMIDPVSRNRMIVEESRHRDVAVLLFDVILGYGSADNVLNGLEGIRSGPVAIASVTGTENDPQGYWNVVRSLEDMDVRVLPTAAMAAEYAALIMETRA